MEDIVKNLILTKDEYSNVGYKIRNEIKPSIEFIIHLFNWLPNDKHIIIYNEKKQDNFDNGEYIEIRKNKKNTYNVTIGNHGWKRKVIFVFIKKYANILLENWNYNKNEMIIKGN